MTILIGVDEAGYGPNLGPLAVAATAWCVGAMGDALRNKSRATTPTSKHASPRAAASSPAAAIAATPVALHRDEVDLYALLREGVTRDGSDRGARSRKRNGERALRGDGAPPVAIADSKALYKPGSGLRTLERGVLAAWTASSGPPTLSTTDLMESLGADPHKLRRRLPWHAEDALALPLEATRDDVAGAAELLRTSCLEAGVQLVSLRARLVFPAEFNALVDVHGTKGAALSHVTLALVREIVDEAIEAEGMCAGGGDAEFAGGGDAPARGEIVITCDKHGGRNRYAALVQSHFPESWIEIHGESRAASRYAWSHRGASCTATFRVGGEAELPAALASMTAKYLRELAMHEFNAWWRERVPGLKPTAGYPVDAKRFKREIAAVQQRLGVADRDLWRDR
ncbi:MAG: hypothetical protein KF688_09580 [Pirellulales bacterium]|nr:hypothetical protein [Pirellulales bacterium]